MFVRKNLPVWAGILLLSGLFLTGQEPWNACGDRDLDGYGNPASPSCAYPYLDCVDDPSGDPPACGDCICGQDVCSLCARCVNPAALESPHGDTVCGDGADNDCDGLTDLDDNGCKACVLAEDCDDANPCTRDACVDALCAYENIPGLCDDGDPCTQDDLCSGGVCAGEPLDADQDSFVSAACGGLDCDDSRAEINPGLVEGHYGDPLCGDGLDNDCDELTDTDDPGCWQCTDAEDCDDLAPCTADYCLIDGSCLSLPATGNPCDDGDPCTMADACLAGVCTGQPLDGDGDTYAAMTCGGSDCDDANPGVNPGAAEDCDNGIDDNCNGLTDLEDPACPCQDADADGYGDPVGPSCAHPERDCDDTDPAINPGIDEEGLGLCNDGIDQDCDGADCTAACTDSDGDGYGDPPSPGCPFPERDCDDTDPEVNPGEVDHPDDTFTDHDCDGIDGDRDRLYFVDGEHGLDSPLSGTPETPFRTLTYALEAAAADPGIEGIAVSEGSYDEAVSLREGLSIHGAYSLVHDWARSQSYPVVITNPAAVGEKLVTLDAVNLTAPGSVEWVHLETGVAGPEQSTYGVFATNSIGLVLRHCTILARAGGNGGGGTGGSGQADAGADGSPGQAGCEDDTIFCGSCSQPHGGNGGGSVCGMAGGRGGDSGHGEDFGESGNPGAGGAPGGPGTPDGRGNWDTPDTYWGANGQDGSDGADGTAGEPLFQASGYDPVEGMSGEDATAGTGGGGGGGGGGGEVNCDSYGGGGGGGGGGGCGGTPGTGGTSAGGSFGVYLWNSELTTEDLSITVVGGGLGGAGGVGQTGGPGGSGGHGALPGAGNPYGGGDQQDDASNGGRGGDGGNGGQGGSGGGGAGGPSVGILLGGASTLAESGSYCSIGAAGLGGESPAGNSGPDGVQGTVVTVP